MEITEATNPRPHIDTPDNLSIILPAGLIGDDGRLVKEVDVKELNGEAEEELARAARSGSLSRFMGVVVEKGVAAIGGSPPTKLDLLSLLLGDRDTIILAVRKATYGNVLRLTLTCRNCGKDMNVKVDLDEDVPVRPMENPSQRTFEVELRDGSLAKVRLPLVKDQNDIFEEVSDDSTLPQINTQLLARCVRSVDDRPWGGVSSAKALGMVDRETLLRVISEHTCGPDYGNLDIECPKCAQVNQIVVDPILLFRS